MFELDKFYQNITRKDVFYVARIEDNGPRIRMIILMNYGDDVPTAVSKLFDSNLGWITVEVFKDKCEDYVEITPYEFLRTITGFDYDVVQKLHDSIN